MEWVPKSWGGELIITNNDLYCGKKLLFFKGHRSSFHYHKLKKETFYVRQGRILMLYTLLSYLDNCGEQEIGHKIQNAERNVHLTKVDILSTVPVINFMYLEEGDTFQIDPLLVHQAIALKDSEVLEFSTHSDDSDSYRIVIGH